VEVLNPLKDVSQNADRGTEHKEERHLEGLDTNTRSETKQPLNDSIPESLKWRFDAFRRGVDMVYSGSAE
jgi:hypothetical protein